MDIFDDDRPFLQRQGASATPAASRVSAVRRAGRYFHVTLIFLLLLLATAGHAKRCRNRFQGYEVPLSSAIIAAPHAFRAAAPEKR